jgi:hypothetical protein
MMLHTFRFPVVPPALETPAYLDQGLDPRVVPEAEEHAINCSVAPPVALETEERTFIDFTARETADESEHPSADIAKDPAISRRKGSFFLDQKGIYNLEWPSVAEFDVWCWEIEIANSIEFKRSTVKWVRTRLWTCTRLFVCGRQDTGKHNSTKTDPNRKAIESKKIECPCQFIIKEYPHTEIILGRHLD